MRTQKVTVRLGGGAGEADTGGMGGLALEEGLGGWHGGGGWGGWGYKETAQASR